MAKDTETLIRVAEMTALSQEELDALLKTLYRISEEVKYQVPFTVNDKEVKDDL